MVEFWYAALESPLGIIVETDDPERLRQRLYAARAQVSDPALACLSLIIPSEPGQVWIAKKESSDGA